MARKDARALRDEVASAIDKGKWKRAIECIQELEALEPRDASWPKRAAEVWRRLGKTREAIAAYERAIERYAQGGFLVQAIAVAKQILQLDPKHGETLQRLAAMTEERQTAPHGMRSFGVAAEAIPELIVGRATGPVPKLDPATLASPDRPVDMLDLPDRRSRPIPVPQPEPGSDFALPDAAPPKPVPVPVPVAKVTPPVSFRPPAPPPPPLPPRRPDGTPPLPTATTRPPPIPPPPPMRKRRSSPPPYGSAPKRARPDSAPIILEKGAPLDRVPLASIIPGAEAERTNDGLSSGIIVIPLEELDDGTGPIAIETLAQEPEDLVDIPLDAVETPEPVPFEELELEAMDEDDFAASHTLSATAARALRNTPLLAGLDGDQLEALVAKLSVIQLEPGQILFKEGDQGDTLFIVSEGEIAVISEGPPRRELSRLLPGAFFGEVALITEQPRSATIAAIARTELLAIDRDVVRALVAEHPDTLRVILLFIKNRLVERVIQTSALFVQFADPDRRSLAERFDFLEVEPGTRLITQGARPDGLYVILAGRAEAERDLAGATRKLGMLGPGEVFGEMSLWGAEQAVATVMAKDKMLALRMPANDFREIIMTHPQVLAYVGDLAEERRRAAEAPPEDSGDVVDLKLDLL